MLWQSYAQCSELELCTPWHSSSKFEVEVHRYNGGCWDTTAVVVQYRYTDHKQQQCFLWASRINDNPTQFIVIISRQGT